MAKQRIKVYEEKRGLSIWLWIVPLVLVICFVTVFLLRVHPTPSTAPIAGPHALSLPELGFVQFEPGKPTLTPEGQATVDRALESMRGNPNVRLRLEGYPPGTRKTDPLTGQRSQTITRILETAGIETSRLTGGPFARPSAASPSQKGESDYRRVELYVR